MTDSLVDLHFR